MYCEIIRGECPYPDLVSNGVDYEELVEIEVRPELECATGKETVKNITTQEVCGIAALECLSRNREIHASFRGNDAS